MKRIKKFISILLCMLVMSSSFKIENIQVFAFNESYYVINQDGYFTGTNNQSGAINFYLLNGRLLTDDTVVYVEYNDVSKDKTSSYYWVASQNCIDDSMDKYVIGKARMITLDSDGDTVTYKVIKGKLRVGWPPYDNMVCSYDVGNEQAQGNPDDEKPDSDTIDVLKQLNMDELFEDGKFVLFTAKEIKSLSGGDTGLIDFLNSFFESGCMVKDEGMPIAINHTKMEDGSILWKIIYPKESSDEESDLAWYEKLYNDSKAWDQYKNKVELVKKTVSDVMEVSQMAKDRDFPMDISLIVGGTKIFGGESILSEFLKPDLSACGYLEFTTDKDYNLISGKGQVAGTMEADSKKYIRQYFSPLGLIWLPWYWEIDYDYKGGICIDTTLKKNRLNKVLMDRQGKVDCVGNVNAAAGVGLYGVVNAQGNLAMNVQTELFPNSKLTIAGTVDASLRFFKYYKSNVLGPFTFEKTLWDEKADDKVIELSESAQTYSMDESIIEAMELWSESNAEKFDSGISVMDDADTISENDWSGAEGTDYKVIGVGANGKTLLSNSMQGCDPKIIRLGDKSILLFTAMTSQDIENAGRLLYSVKVNDVWSEPKILWDNSYPDYYADMQIIGDKVYVVWQKSSTSVNGADTESAFDDAIAKSEICVAEFDSESNTFINQKYLTMNNHLDMLPQFVKNTNQVAVSFISNTNNDFMGTSDSAINLMTYEDGMWSEVSEIATVSGYIGEYETYISNGSYKVLYNSMDISKASENEPILSNMYMTDGIATDIINKDAKSILGLKCYDGRMFWLCDGSLYKMDCSSEAVTDLLASAENMDGKSIGADFRVIGNGEKTSIVWGATSETGYSIYSALINENKISKPLDVFQHEGGTVESYDVAMNADGSYCYIINDMDNNDSKYTMSEIVKEVQDSIELTNVYMPDYEREDDKQPVSVTITNQGESVIKNLCMKIVSNNTEYVKKEFTTSINPGESVCINGSFILPRISNPKEFSVMLYSDVQGEEYASKYTTTLGNTDVAVEATKIIDKDKGVIVYKVTNNSNTETDCTLNLYAGNGYNEELEKFDISELGAGQSEYIRYTINSQDLDFEANIAAFYAVVESRVDDYRVSNNSALITFIDDEFSSENQKEDETTETNTVSDEEEMTESEPSSADNTTTESEGGSGDNTTTETEKASNEENTTESETTSKQDTELINFSNALIKMEQDEYTYQGTAIYPDISVVIDGKIISDSHYDVEYYNNVNAGTAKVVITSKKDDSSYTGKAEREFTILKSTQKIEVDSSVNKITVGKSIIVKPKSKVYGSVSYLSNNKKAISIDDTGRVSAKSPGTAKITVSVSGNQNYKSATTTMVLTVLPKDTEILLLDNISNGIQINWEKNKHASGYYIYRSKDGNNFKKVAGINSGAITKWTDSKAATNGSRYSYKIVAYTKIGNSIYKSSESRVKYFYYMSTPTVKSVSNYRVDGILVRWSKNSKASGYEIKYILDSKPKVIRVNKGSSEIGIIRKLKKGKRYSISVRSYKKIGSRRYYSNWSKVKRVKH